MLRLGGWTGHAKWADGAFGAHVWDLRAGGEQGSAERLGNGSAATLPGRCQAGLDSSVNWE